MNKMAHVAEYKKRIVDDIVKLVKEYPIVGAVNMENLPAPQLQTMRAQLRGKVIMAMTKRRLMKIALDRAKNEKRGIEKLEEHLKGMPALIFTKDSPFKLSRILRKNKSKAPAKAGQTAPNDIIVNKGSTGFAPGPIIGELGMVGIKAGVEGGKVAVKEDTVVVKQGEQIKPKVAEILTRLGIEPMEVGLDLMAAYEDGLIYTKDILTIDDKEYMDRLDNAARNSFNLAFNAAYTTNENILLLVGKAFNDAKALGLSQEIIEEGIVGELLAKAERSMLSLRGTANIQVEEKAEVKEEKAEEKKPTEEKKPEEKEVLKEEPKKEIPQKGEAKKEVPEKEIKKEPLKKEIEEKPEEVKKQIQEVPKPAEEKKPEVKKDAMVEGQKQESKEKKEILKREPVVEEKKEEIKPEKEPIKQETKKPKIQEESPKEEAKPEPEKIKKEEPKIEEKIEVKRAKPETDKKVEEMVKRTKEFMEGKQVTAEQVVKEVEKEAKAEEPEKEAKEEEKKEKEEVPSAHELEKRKKEKEQKEVEDLAKELVKKGTLRDKK